MGFGWSAHAETPVISIASLPPAQKSLAAIPSSGGAPQWWRTAVVAHGRALYVRGTNGGDISRLDSATGAVVWTQPGPGFIGNFGLDQLGLAADGIWLSGPTTARLDPATGKIAETIRLASNSAAAGNNELWLVLLDGSVVKLQKR